MKLLPLAPLVLLAACSSSEVTADAETAVPAASDGPAADAAATAADLEVVDGREAPDFRLTATDGSTHALADYLADGKTVVLEWFNPDCPFSRAYHSPQRRMAATFADAGDDVVWLAINSGAPGKQGAGLDRNKKAVADWDIPYPVLLDEDGAVGKAYGAKTTPHMYVIEPGGQIVYEGAIDDSSGRGEASRQHVDEALAALAAGGRIEHAATKPFGCSVKYAN